MFLVTYYRYQLIALEVICVLTMIAIVLVLSYDTWLGWRTEDKIQKRETAARSKEHSREMMRKEAIRRDKEKAANEGFFEESYITGFDANGSIYHRPRVVPTHKAMAYYREMEELTNTQQFNIVEEIQSDLSNPKD